MTCPRCGRPLMRGWCAAHGTIVDELPDRAAVEEPVARRRKDLYARVGTAWAKHELRFLRDHKDRMSVREIARRLNRSPKAVTNMLSKMRLRKHRVSSGPDRWSPTKVGAPGQRWTREEDEALLASVGVGKERSVMISHRSIRACHERLWQLGEGRAEDQDGKLSGAQVARLYECPESRVDRLIRTGQLPAYKGVASSWRIDPLAAEEVSALLRAPKRTWKGSPPDVGDYRERYGLSRRATG